MKVAVNSFGNIINSAIKEAITDNKNIKINDYFIGPDTFIESIDIVQIIAIILD